MEKLRMSWLIIEFHKIYGVRRLSILRKREEKIRKVWIVLEDYMSHFFETLQMELLFALRLLYENDCTEVYQITHIVGPKWVIKECQKITHPHHVVCCLTKFCAIFFCMCSSILIVFVIYRQKINSYIFLLPFFMLWFPTYREKLIQ